MLIADNNSYKRDSPKILPVTSNSSVDHIASFAMKFFSSAVLFASVAVLSVSASSKCKVPTHYKEIGCTGVTKEGEECPSSYNCDHLAEAGKSATEECHFRGQVYGDFQGPERDQLPNCVPYAHCHNGNFMAGHIDCGPLPYGDDNCLIIRDGCCPSAVCGKEEMAKVHVCFLDGEKFHKGERKSPKDDPCVECTCDEKFDNSTIVAENKNCKTVDCFSDFWHVKDYKKNCAPVYYGKDRCCASHTKCREWIG